MKAAGYVRVRRGLLEHVPTLAPIVLKVYLWILLNAKPVGRDKGTYGSSAREIARDLGMRVESVSRAIRQLEQRRPKPFLEVERSRSRHAVTIYRVLRYSGGSDEQFTVPQNGTVGGSIVPKQGVSSGTIDQVKPPESNRLQTPNTEKNKRSECVPETHAPFQCFHTPGCKGIPGHILRLIADACGLDQCTFTGKELGQAKRLAEQVTDNSEITGCVEWMLASDRNHFWETTPMTPDAVLKRLPLYRKKQSTAEESYGTKVTWAEVERGNREIEEFKAKQRVGTETVQ